MPGDRAEKAGAATAHHCLRLIEELYFVFADPGGHPDAGWATRKTTWALSLNGRDWKMVGYMKADGDVQANHVPEACVESEDGVTWIYLTYGAQVPLPCGVLPNRCRNGASLVPAYSYCDDQCSAGGRQCHTRGSPPRGSERLCCVQGVGGQRGDVGQILLRGSGVSVSVSRDVGLHWDGLEWTPGQTVQLPQVAGATEYLVRVELFGLDSLLTATDIETLTQLNGPALPRLTRGSNRIVVRLGPQLETIQFRPSIVGGRHRETVYSEKSLDVDAEPDFYKPTLRPPSCRRPVTPRGRSRHRHPSRTLCTVARSA